MARNQKDDIVLRPSAFVVFPRIVQKVGTIDSLVRVLEIKKYTKSENQYRFFEICKSDYIKKK